MQSLRQVLQSLPTSRGTASAATAPEDSLGHWERRAKERRAWVFPLESRDTRLRFAAQAAGFGTYDLDCTTGDSVWSPELRAMAGLPESREPLSTEEAEALIHPDDRGRFLEEIRASLNSSGTGEFEGTLRLLRPDGTIRWVSTRGRTFHAEQKGIRRPIAATGIVMDITDGVTTEEALRRSKDDLEMAVRGANIGVWHRDLENGRVEWSECHYQLFGLTPGIPITTEGFMAMVHPDDREAMEIAVRRAVKTHEICDLEYRVVRPDGTVRWIASLGRALYPQSRDRAAGLRGISFDITDKKLREEALRDQKDRLETVVEDRTRELDQSRAALDQLRIFVEQAPSSIAMFDTRMDYLGASMGWCGIVGRRLDQLIGHNHYQVTPDLPERWKEVHSAALSGRPQEEDEDLWVCADGRHRWMHWAVYPWRDDHGAIGGIIIACEDITERKLAEKRLQESEVRFRSAFEQVAVGMAHVSLEGKFIRVNAKFAGIVGYGPDALMHMTFQEITHPDDVREDAARKEQLRRGQGSGYAMEKRYIRPDGSPIWVNLTVSLVRDAAGEPDYFVSVVENIQARKEAEQALAKEREARQRMLAREVAERTAQVAHSNEILMRTNMELKHFAHAAAHDLQTPLRSIAGFAQLLHQSAQSKLTGREADWLDLVIDNTKRLQKLIQELLTYARLDSLARPLEATDLKQVVDEVLASLSIPIGETGAEVVCRNLPTLPVDRTQFAQLVQNLIENAIKYRAERPPRIILDCKRHGEEWIFSVADNGMGIEPRHQQQIFEIFRRLHTYNDIPGTGIGLAICRRVVERHGGSLWVESEPGQGSTFFFTLPNAGAAP